MIKIGIISDTHGLLRPEVLEALKGCSCILHGGDINRQKILDTLEDIAPVYVVRGNNDKEWAEFSSRHIYPFRKPFLMLIIRPAVWLSGFLASWLPGFLAA